MDFRFHAFQSEKHKPLSFEPVKFDEFTRLADQENCDRASVNKGTPPVIEVHSGITPESRFT